MMNKIFNLDAYDLIPLGLAVFLIGSFAFPAYNQFTYDANLKHVVNTKNDFNDNLERYQQSWYDLGQNFEAIEYNDFNIYPNKDGFAGGEGVSGTAENSYDCQNIFLSLTDNEYFIEIGDPKKIDKISEETEYVTSYNEKSYVCKYTYIEKQYVKRLKNKQTHVITYNTKSGEVNLLKNSYTF